MMYRPILLDRRTVLISAAVATLSGLAGCAGKESSGAASGSAKSVATSDGVELRYGFVANNTNKLEGLVGVADSKGFIKEELSKVGATFKAVPFVKAGPAINSALESSSLDMGDLGDVPAISAKSRGARTTLTTVYPQDFDTLVVVPKDSNISSIQDLKGKRVAVQTGSYMYRIILQILADSNIAASEVQFVNMTEVDSGAAIASGAVDASPLTGIKGNKLILDGSAKAIYSTRGHDDQTAQEVIIGRTDYLKANPDVVVAFYKAVIRASEAVKNDTAPLRQQEIDNGIDPEVVDKTHPDQSYYVTNYKVDDNRIKILQDAADFLVKNKIIDNTVNVSSWYDGSYYDRAAKELGE